MTQQGESNKYSASDHLSEIVKYLGFSPTYMLVDDNKASRKTLKKYEQEQSFPVKVDFDNLEKIDVKLIKKRISSEKNLLRNDPQKLAKELVSLL